MNMNDWMNLHFLRAPDDEGAGGTGDEGAGGDEGSDGDKSSGEGAGGDEGSDGDKSSGEGSDGDKSSGDKSDDGEAAKEGNTDAADGVEDFTLTVPEGAEEHSEAIGEFNTHMKTWLTDNPKATMQDAVQEGIAYQKTLHDAAMTSAVEQAEERATAWIDDIKADKEFGGDKFDQSSADAKRAVEAYGDQELKDLLDESGLGNHPAVFRAFARAAKGVKEADVAKGDAARGKEAGLADTLYPD